MGFTYFFRDMHTLRLIERHVIPELKGRKYIHVWDAGCSRGAEPYSLAILLRENTGEFLFRNVRIYATDVNGDLGNIVGKARYPAEQVKRMPQELLTKYFVPAEEPEHFVVAEPIRKVVTFQQHDLTSLQPIRDGLGLILCKNVLLHLREEQRVDVIRMFHHALMAAAFLVMEQTQRMPERLAALFERVTHEGQVFRRRE